jgi:rhodanese-related sulfurtransferase
MKRTRSDATKENTMSELSISQSSLQGLLSGTAEVAVLDVREARAFNAGHLNLARHAPLSTLELRIARLVPRLATAVVLIDDDNAIDGPAAVAAELLLRAGYTDVRRLSGGMRAWNGAGLPAIDGYNTLVKAFADLARRHYRTPTLQVGELAERRKQGLPTTVVDVRPRNEYEFLTISGAANYPGTELALRRYPAGDAQHVLAINCFSRTRGIIGTTTLRLLGLSDQAAFVEDGVMAWGLQGSAVEQSAANTFDIAPLPASDLRTLADSLTKRFGLQRIDTAQLLQLQEDRERSLYLFDVRQTAGDNPQSAIRSVAGGQLLMHYENFIGTRNPRVVLIDDAHGLRAAITAFWLSQLNQAEVYILDAPPAPSELAKLQAPALRSNAQAPAPAITVEELLRRRDSFAVVDVGPSIDFEREHIPGAYFLLPSSFKPLKKILAPGRTIVFTSPDGVAAKIAACDAQLQWPDARIAWLAGGTQQWKIAGLKLEARYDSAQLLTPFDDDWGSVMRVFGPRRDEAWREYLDWEKTFSERVVNDKTVQFRFFPLDHS